MPLLIDQAGLPRHDSSNDRIRKFVTVQGPSSYTTGGEAVAPVAAGLGQVHLFNAEPAIAAAGTSVRLVRYDYVNQKVQWFGENFAEIANGVDLSTYSARVEIVGR